MPPVGLSDGRALAQRMPAFAAALRARRDEADAALALAHDGGVSDIPGVLADLAGWEPTLARATAATAAGAAGATGQVGAPALALDVLVVALDLAAQGRWRPDSPARSAVTAVAPRLDWWSGERSRVRLHDLARAADTLAAAEAATTWADRLARVPDPGAHDREVIAVVAWRSGVVRLRRAALTAARTLPPRLAAAALELPEVEVASALARNASDPWDWPGAQHSGVLRRIPTFRGDGGRCLGRPVVEDGADWLVWDEADAGVWWRVLADVHGAEFRALAGEPPSSTATSGAMLARLRGAVPWQDTVTGAAGVGETYLVSRAHSYALDVVRLGPA